MDFKILIYAIIYYVAINIIGFLVMFYDKKMAIKNRWRVSEKTLFLIATIFGSVGMYLGMIVFRHKTKHLKFKIGIPVIIYLQFSIIVYLLINYFLM